jgi:hypothetical protein
MGWPTSTASSKRASELRRATLAFPATAADVQALRRAPSSENLLPRLDELTAATLSLGLPPRRTTAAGRAPFSLEEQPPPAVATAPLRRIAARRTRRS